MPEVWDWAPWFQSRLLSWLPWFQLPDWLPELCPWPLWPDVEEYGLWLPEELLSELLPDFWPLVPDPELAEMPEEDLELSDFDEEDLELLPDLFLPLLSDLELSVLPEILEEDCPLISPDLLLPVAF
jgi:hypothetical protein